MNLPPSQMATKSSKTRYRSSRDVRWCSGCGDFHVLNALTSAWAQLELATENIALVSGIGCSSRLPYYCSSYGFHTIHGRAPAVAYGLHKTRPDLSIWIITGDGDGLSIGAGHLTHLCRRNPNMTVLLFNNQIYGLTKGQTSPTSAMGLTTKSHPRGTTHQPLNALSLAISSGATFAARVIDTDLAGMRKVFMAAQKHHGLGFVEILTSCVVFHEEAYREVEKKKQRAESCLELTAGEPLLFGQSKEFALTIDPQSLTPKVIPAHQNTSSLLIHDPARPDPGYGLMIARLARPSWPMALGVLRDIPIPIPQTNTQKKTGLDELMRKHSFQRGVSQSS